MKNIKMIKMWLAGSVLLSLSSCYDNILETIPPAVAPENYLLETSHLEAYANGLYGGLPSGEMLIWDQHTDNQANVIFSGAYVPGEVKVAQTGGNWSFGTVYNCNYFLNIVVPRIEAGTIIGSADNAKHYVGEVYFLRALNYFSKLQSFGDFPIVTETLKDDLVMLTEASKRSPRNEVARFILSDLDKAIELMATTPDTRKTRINKESALLLKSRVALYEGTWLKYFKGTAFVPNGPEWSGAAKDYNSGYAFPSGSIENEINFFLEQAMDASQKVADAITLTANTGTVRQALAEPVNPYDAMFASVDLSGVNEVLLWREYSSSLGLVHRIGGQTNRSNDQIGVTRGMVESFLMENGLPVYASGSGYHGDNYIADVRKDRDNRLYLFLKEPGQINVFQNLNMLTPEAWPVEPIPQILISSGDGYPTGYALRKGSSGDALHIGGAGTGAFTGTICYRGVEALLNYMEASYERNGTIDATAEKYWRAIRNRAKVDPDFNKTIAATQMDKEAPNDWGTYSAGQLIDPTLYNIRRERRCELMGEGLRNMDLTRWRAKDQMITTPYHIEGFKLYGWDYMYKWYNNAEGNTTIWWDDNCNTPGTTASPPSRSEYLRPYEKVRTNLVFDGYRWAMAHYLEPVAVQHFLITSQDNDISTSPIYQNPGWGTVAGEGAKY